MISRRSILKMAPAARFYHQAFIYNKPYSDSLASSSTKSAIL